MGGEYLMSFAWKPFFTVFVGKSFFTVSQAVSGKFRTGVAQFFKIII